MKILIHLVAAVALIAGAYFVFQALATPGKYPLSSASAVQATQVYTEAMYYALVATALFLLGILIEVAGIAEKGN